MGVAGPTHDARSWTFDLDPGGRDPVLGIERLQEAFLARFPDYEKGITVPAIVDVTTGQVVTNDYPQITLDLSLEWREHPREIRKTSCKGKGCQYVSISVGAGTLKNKKITATTNILQQKTINS